MWSARCCVMLWDGALTLKYCGCSEDEEDGQSPQAGQVLGIASPLLKPLISGMT